MVTIKLSNKAVYTFIAVCIFLACVGVSYAWAPSGTGHNLNEMNCGSGYSSSCDGNSDGKVDSAYLAVESVSQVESSELYRKSAGWSMGWVEPDLVLPAGSSVSSLKKPLKLYKPAGTTNLEITCTLYQDKLHSKYGVSEKYKYCIDSVCSEIIDPEFTGNSIPLRESFTLDISSLATGWHDFIPQVDMTGQAHSKFLGYCSFLFR